MTSNCYAVGRDRGDAEATSTPRREVGRGAMDHTQGTRETHRNGQRLGSSHRTKFVWIMVTISTYCRVQMYGVVWN